MSDEKKTTDELKKQTEELEKQNKILQERADKARETLATLQETGVVAIELNQAADHAVKTAEAAAQVAEADLAKEKQKLKQFKKALAAKEQITDKDKEALEALEKQVAAAEELADELARAAENKAIGTKLGKEMASAVFGVNQKWKSTFWGQLAGGGFTEKLSSLGKGFAQAMNPADMLGSTLMKVQESTVAAVLTFDSTTASLAAATGQGTRYNDMIMEVSATNRRFGVGMKEAAAAIQGLNEGMSGFTDLSDDVASAMVAQTAQLEKLGVAASTTGKMNDQFMKGMGMTADQAMAVNNDLARTAMGLGIPVAKMAADFEGALPQLAAWGKEAPKIFKKVAAAAKGLGVEMNTLLGFASQFDTFEGAATAVGKLNNILGGDMLNSYEMINASEEERIRMLLQGVDASGKSWESMSRFEKMAVANAAGISDMAEANKMFSGGLRAYDEAQRKAQANAVSQKELEERTQAAVSVQEKMTQIMEAFAVAVQPVVEFLHGFTNAILAVNDATGGLLVPVVLTLIGAYAVFYNVMKQMMVLKAAKAAMDARETAQKVADTTATGANTAANLANAGAKSAQATASTALAAGMQAQSLAQSAVGATAPVASAGTVGLSAALTSLGGNPFAVAAVLMLGMLALGMGLVAVAAAVTVYSIVQLVKAFMEMPEAIVPALLGLVAFLGIMALVVAGVALLAPIAPLFMLSAMMIGAGLAYLGPGMMMFALTAFLFAKALEVWDEAAMLKLLYLGTTLSVFSLMIGAVAPLMYLAGVYFGPAALLLGLGLGILGLAIKQWKPSMVEMLPLLGGMLAVLALTLFKVAPLMYLAGAYFGPGALLVGIGLGVLGLAIGLFGKKTIDLLPVLALSLGIFALGLVAASGLMLVAGALFGPGALLLGIGLGILGLALKLFDKETIDTMLHLSYSLILFSLSLIPAALFVAAAALAMSPAAIQLGLGLAALGLALMLFDKDAFKAMEGLMIAIIPFSMAMFVASIYMGYAGVIMGYTVPLLALSLIALSVALTLFGEPAINAMKQITLYIVPFAENLAIASPLFLKSAALLFVASALLAASLYFLPAALIVFATSMVVMASSLALMPISKLQAMSEFLGGLAGLSSLGAAALSLYAIASGIFAVALALRFMPEEKAFALSEVVNSVTRASVEVTPAAVENVTGLVEQAANYADVQAKFKAPSVDAFVQALKQVNESSGGGGKTASSGGGRDIVLELNGRELGRAIDAHMEDKHNLRST